MYNGKFALRKWELFTGHVYADIDHLKHSKKIYWWSKFGSIYGGEIDWVTVNSLEEMEELVANYDVTLHKKKMKEEQLKHKQLKHKDVVIKKRVKFGKR